MARLDYLGTLGHRAEKLAELGQFLQSTRFTPATDRLGIRLASETACPHFAGASVNR